MEFLTWLDGTALSTALKESLMLYPAILALHTIGFVFLVGASVAINLRILRGASVRSLAPMERFFPIMYAGFWLNFGTGVLLFINGPVTVGTNRFYWVKMLFVVLGVVTMLLMKKQVIQNRAGLDLDVNPPPVKARTLAWLSLFVWFLATFFGRSTAYIR